MIMDSLSINCSNSIRWIMETTLCGMRVQEDYIAVNDGDYSRLNRRLSITVKKPTITNSSL